MKDFKLFFFVICCAIIYAFFSSVQAAELPKNMLFKDPLHHLEKKDLAVADTEKADVAPKRSLKDLIDSDKPQMVLNETYIKFLIYELKQRLGTLREENDELNLQMALKESQFLDNNTEDLQRKYQTNLEEIARVEQFLIKLRSHV